MTTFQAIAFGILHGFAEFLPIAPGAHHILLPYFLGWPQPSGVFSGTLSAGALLSLLIYFRHDWASIVSTFLQVIIFRKKPMTLDERLPIFITIATLPSVAGWYYFRERLLELFSQPLWVAGTLVIFSLPLWLADSMSRKNKGMFDWNWLDSALVGIGQAFLLVPGAGRTAGSMSGALFRGFNREAAAKFTFFAAAPVLVGSAFLQLRELDFHAAAPMTDVSWFTLAVTFVVTMLAGLLAIGGFMKHVQRKGFGEYVLYRFALALIVCVTWWWRGRN